MRFDNFSIEDLFTRCMDSDDMTLEMDREEFAALRRKVAELRQTSNSPVIPDGYVLLPKVPSQAHLESIAMRDRHDFGLLQECTRSAVLASARQMYEECTGQGFYKVPAPQPEASHD